MPQLWIETWVGQYFWFLIILFIFHFFMVNKVIPTIATILKIRKVLGSKEEKSEVVEGGSKMNTSIKVLFPVKASTGISSGKEILSTFS
jgi:hypothetical protein